jgi:hypothetical protein
LLSQLHDRIPMQMAAHQYLEIEHVQRARPFGFFGSIDDLIMRRQTSRLAGNRNLLNQVCFRNE